ncbi:MAG: D-alanyl-D-alanine carboxypeptidase [Desulfoarculaceae bacterium]|nr:D-alanyl-D-alanine carboxypeptidase [Desulfoarculaceae bacterium]
MSKKAKQHRKAGLLLTGLLCCFNPGWPGLLQAGPPVLQAPWMTEGRPAAAVSRLIQQGGYALAPNGAVSIAENSAIPFVPASTLKILTGLAALDILGPAHRFATRISRDLHNNLYIQGGGDPFLLTENVITIVQKLQEAGIQQINNLIMDESVFQLDSPADGSENTTNPYDAWNGGLAVNFNSIAIRVAPDRTVSPDDPKLPWLPMMQAIGAALPPGHHRVNVNAFKPTGQISNTLRYSGELFMSLLQRQQVEVRGIIMAGQTPIETTPVLTYWSEKTLRDMLQQCLKYSNNFIANQLFLACGTARYGAPATWNKARAALQSYYREHLGLSESELMMVEGSGLSRRNRITPRAMITILREFAPYRELLPVKQGLPLKSGTLTGVYCYAGYLPHQQDAPFVILLNQAQNNRDKILHILAAGQKTEAELTASK